MSGLLDVLLDHSHASRQTRGMNARRLLTDDIISLALGDHKPRGLQARAQTVAVFKNAFVERYLARAHWTTPGLWFLPVASYGAYRGYEDVQSHALAPWMPFALALAGWLFWSIFEYTLHRYVFHTLEATPEHPERYLVHGYHHDFPDDRWRLVMVPLGSWPLGVAFGAAFRLALGPTMWAPAFGGMVLGYVAYDWLHYYCHHARPKRGIGKWLRNYHLRHHFAEPVGRFGVSTPLWDWVFRTHGERVMKGEEG